MALNQTNKARVDCAETCAAIALKILFKFRKFLSLLFLVHKSV